MNTESYSFSEILEITGLSAPEFNSLIERRKAVYKCKFFRDERGKWHIGEERYSHMDGFTDICEWLRGNGKPTSEQYVDDDNLYSISDANSDYGVNFTRLDGSGIPNDGILDSKARQGYKARLQELENLLAGSEDMDDEECAEVRELREEQVSIRRELNAATNVFGASRDLVRTKAAKGTDAKRKRAERAIKKIGTNQLEIASYLKENLKFGAESGYFPPDIGAWEFILDGKRP